MENNEINIITLETCETTYDKSQECIDCDNKKNKMYLINAEEMTKGKGSGNRKWSAKIKGNVYTTFCIPIAKIPQEIYLFMPYLCCVSICQELNKLMPNTFNLKWPNDIICKDLKKVCGSMIVKYKDYLMIGFGINLVGSPEETELRKGGLQACYFGKHSNNIPKALDLSLDISKTILNNFKLNKDDILKLYKQMLNLSMKITKRGNDNVFYNQVEVNDKGNLVVINEKGEKEIIEYQMNYH